MRISLATLTVASLITILAVLPAQAAPTQVNVRIEGKTETLFEGPIWTEGHDVQASSDTKERSCDGINPLDPQNKTSGPTPTAASVDAMSLIGETFDGQWYPGYNDYFITRWGPDEEEGGMSWGILVNNVFTNVGGCQYELSTGDEALWAFNAFGGKPFLALFAVEDAYHSGTRPLTAMAELGKPLEVEVVNYSDDKEDVPPVAPERMGSSPFEGADVSPVKTAVSGLEKVESGSSQTVKTNAQGRASITFTEPGWHRIKATAFDGEGKEDVIRSNRLDVCVPKEGETGCGEPPLEDRVRTPTYIEEEIKREQEARSSPEIEGNSASATPKVTERSIVSGSTVDGLARIQGPTLNSQGTTQGLVSVSWRILEPGAGLSSWRISSKTLGSAQGDYVTRATGTNATSALLALPEGALYELQITFTSVLGLSSTARIGEVLVPHDDRWDGLRYRGHWRRMRQRGAWHGTVSRADAGAQVSARLGAGRPVLQLRGTPRAAKVEVLAGSSREVFAIAGSPADALRQITTAKRSHAGIVSLRVLRGTVDLDGVAVEP